MGQSIKTVKLYPLFALTRLGGVLKESPNIHLQHRLSKNNASLYVVIDESKYINILDTETEGGKKTLDLDTIQKFLEPNEKQTEFMKKIEGILKDFQASIEIDHVQQGDDVFSSLIKIAIRIDYEEHSVTLSHIGSKNLPKTKEITKPKALVEIISEKF